MKFLNIIPITIFSLILTGVSNAQDQDKRFQFEFGYGIAITGDTEKNDFQLLRGVEFSTPLIGKNLEVATKYVFKNRRFIGLGFTMQSYTNILNGTGVLDEDRVLVFDDYRLEDEIQYIELQYGKFFDNGLDLTISAFTIFYFQPILNQNANGFELGNPGRSSDDLGLAIALGYRLFENNSINVSLRAKLSYSLNGVEAITLTPLVRFNF